MNKNLLPQTKEKGLWSKGKEEMNKFYRVKLSRSTNIKTFVFGLFATLIVILPFALILYQYVELKWYRPQTMILFMSVAWVLLMLCNGLSNYFTVKMAKGYNKEMSDLQDIDENAILFYQSLNIGFGVFVLIVLLFFGVMG